MGIRKILPDDDFKISKNAVVKVESENPSMHLSCHPGKGPRITAV